MIRTRVGYAGGRTNSPNYSNLGNHTETVQIDYNPEFITYSQLLNIFWNSHQPTKQSHSQQYKNVVFFHNKKQHLQTMESKMELEQKIDQTVKTGIMPLGSFTMAEDYHQKYYLKNHALKKEIMRIYPRHNDIVDSTAAARLNGYIGRNGSKEQLSREIENLGLSDAGKRLLIKSVPQ